MGEQLSSAFLKRIHMYIDLINTKHMYYQVQCVECLFLCYCLHMLEDDGFGPCIRTINFIFVRL